MSYSDEISTPPEEFTEQVRQVLEHLYDFPYLRSHPLAHHLRSLSGVEDESQGQLLRRSMLSIMDDLNPGVATPFGSPDARLYNLLHLHYVEGMTVEEAAHEMSVSTRQAYRDLRRGVGHVAAVFWERIARQDRSEPVESPADPVQTELERIGTHPRDLDLDLTLRDAVTAVEPLAAKHNVVVTLRNAEAPLSVTADSLVARQLFVSVLSRAIQQSSPKQIIIESEIADTGIAVRIVGANVVPDGDQVVRRLAESLGWELGFNPVECAVHIMVRAGVSRKPTLLVIDDNEGLVDLVRRYLSDYPCKVISANTGSDGIRRTRESPPDAIVLDVMMPETDGWQVLQQLRAQQGTSEVPVIVCSVLNDPELALALGATRFVPKPVAQKDLVAALRDTGFV